jgi:UDP-N-acetylmuramate--alanine ligase
MMRYHFSGIAGAGMAPLACLMRSRGHDVQGSDRAIDQGKSREVAARLRAAGITVLPHDGSAITREIGRFVHSTAVEGSTPEMQVAAELGLTRVSRPALLAEVVNAGRPGVAIAGTSGKSTITGMIAWLAREAGRAATVIGGASLVGEGTTGGFLAGPGDGPVIAEACESDGTLVGYRPAIGLIHNVSRDHGELPALRAQFGTFAASCSTLLVNALCPEAAAIGRTFNATTYGAVRGADAVLEVLALGPERATGVLRSRGSELKLDVPLPGLHNLENATAAALIALQLGLDAVTIGTLLARFPGVARRFERVGVTASGIRVIDDYAHNGEKLRAAITTAQAGARRVLAVFQPHGFGPARFLRPELRELLPGLLRAHDKLCYSEIFYAGGTVAKDISSRALADDIGCAYAADHAAVRAWVAREARPGDTVLILGARDPELPRLAREVLAALK